MHPDAAEIIRNFLKADLSKRLGNLQGGSDDVKHHKWFTNVDWEDVLNLRIQAPIVPVCSGPGDARNFETYSEELDTRNDDVPLDQFQHYFTVLIIELGILSATYGNHHLIKSRWTILVFIDLLLPLFQESIRNLKSSAYLDNHRTFKS